MCIDIVGITEKSRLKTIDKIKDICADKTVYYNKHVTLCSRKHLKCFFWCLDSLWCFVCPFHSIKLYTTFWSLSLYDLHVPVSRYDEEISKLEQSIKALDDNSDMVSYCDQLDLVICATWHCRKVKPIRLYFCSFRNALNNYYQI